MTPVPKQTPAPSPVLVDTAVQTENPTQQYCVPGCLAGGKQANMDMIRCILCMKWHHQACCDSADELKYESALWTCPACRDIPTDVLSMRKQLSQLMTHRVLPDDLTAIKQMMGVLVDKVNQLTAVIVNKPVISSSSHHHQPEDDKPATTSITSQQHQQSDIGTPTTTTTSSIPHQLQQQSDMAAPTTITTPSIPHQHQQQNVHSEDADVNIQTVSDSETENSPTITTITAEIHAPKSGDSESEIHELDDLTSSESETPPDSHSDASFHQDEDSDSDSESIWLTQRSQKRRTKRRVQLCRPSEKLEHAVRLVCDSIPKNISKQYIARKCSADVTIIQSGSNLNRAADYILQDETEHDTPIIIHSGTNHVEKEGVKRIYDRLERLEHNLVRLQYRHVLLSSIVYRSHSSPTTCENTKHINTRLAMMCAKHKWTFIDNDNIDETCLDADGVHLNSMGDDRLTMNIVRGINYMLH